MHSPLPLLHFKMLFIATDQSLITPTCVSCRGRRGSQGSEPYSPYDFSEEQDVPESKPRLYYLHTRLSTVSIISYSLQTQLDAHLQFRRQIVYFLVGFLQI